ncbi:SET domain-containing protein [Giardia muris]|uniref:SET domain-containing protein n=1 Tax=Giardia muris TaxID=5742 RepID=A0A4Z1STG7_GIAMU|nr:SET domain-containing protein [Giardia muris]|eukprot:TNJ29184.1 SET domain-containing protein [Giardia muris]
MDQDVFLYYDALLTGTVLKVSQSTVPNTDMKGLFLTEAHPANEALLSEAPLHSWVSPGYMATIYGNGEGIDGTERERSRLYCFECMRPIAGIEERVPCKFVKTTEQESKRCRHIYCSEECRDKHIFLGHGALCTSLHKEGSDLIYKAMSIPSTDVPYTLYTIIEVLGHIICKEGYYLLQTENEMLSLQYAFHPFALFEGSSLAEVIDLDVHTILKIILQVLNMESIYEHIFPDIAFEQAMFSLSKATLFSEEMIRHLISLLSLNCYTLRDRYGFERGSALYSILSCCNHSCAPNVRVQMDPDKNGSVIDLVLLTDGAANSELFISYLSIEELGLPTRARRDRLKSWGFRCTCPRCESQDEDEGEKESS